MEPAARQKDLKHEIDRQRGMILRRLEHWLEAPMLLLGLVWLVLLVIELTRGLSPLLLTLSDSIWGVFIVDFAVRFFLAPKKVAYLKRNVLTMLSLMLPALRVLRLARLLRFARAARAVRAVRLLKVAGAINRGMRTFGRTMRQRGLGYVLGVTLIVLFAGAAGMYSFESEASGSHIHNYGAALWWTAMVLTTMGSEYWPQTAEGRVLCLAISIYAFAVFGYITAAIASLFIGQDAEKRNRRGATDEVVQELRREIAELRNLRISGRNTPDTNSPG